MIHLRYIRYFLAVAEHQSFTRAAEALYTSQPALSQHIKSLEESLGAQLFDRSGRKIRLTDTGEVYLHYVRQAFQVLNEGKRAIHDIEDLSRGSLRIAVTPSFITYFIGPLIAELYALYPHIAIQVQESSQDKIENMLLKDEIDIGIGFDETHSPNITSEALLTEKLTLAASANHPLAKRSSVMLNELDNKNFILLSPKFATRLQIDHHFRQAGLHFQVHMEVDSINAIIAIVRRTSLLTIIPGNIPSPDNGLVAIPLSNHPLERTAILMRRKDAWQSVAVKAFAKVAKNLAQKLEK